MVTGVEGSINWEMDEDIADELDEGTNGELMDGEMRDDDIIGKELSLNDVTTSFEESVTRVIVDDTDTSSAV